MTVIFEARYKSYRKIYSKERHMLFFFQVTVANIEEWDNC